MPEWVRDALAEEMGYTICPLHYETYILCDNKCEECKLNIEFKKELEKKYG